jgi:hypothetical protein
MNTKLLRREMAVLPPEKVEAFIAGLHASFEDPPQRL